MSYASKYKLPPPHFLICPFLQYHSHSDKKLDVLAINETRLDPTIPDGFVSIDGYDVLRNDRDRNGGGVCRYVRCNLNYKNCSDLVPNGLEAVCVEIKLNNTQSFIVSSIYRPPCSPSEIFTKIENLIKSIDDECKEFYILGDLNCNMLQSTMSTTKRLQEILELYQLTQMIHGPTRITDSSRSLLDVAITSMPEKITFSGVVHIGISDHSLIYAIRKINARSNNELESFLEFRNFKNFNISSFLDDLYNIPWEQIRFKRNVDEMWKLWKTFFVSVLDIHAPMRKKRLRKRGNIPWVSRKVKAKLFKRDAYKRKAIKTNKKEDWLLYRSSRNAANIALRCAKKDYYANKFAGKNQNPKQAWRTINNLLGRNKKRTTINEIKLSEKTVTTTEELVEVFNDYFSNVGPKLAETIPSDNDVSFRDFITPQTGSSFSFKPVSVTLVNNLLRKLSTSKATGMDKISAKVLKTAAPAIAPSLTEIINMSIDSDQFPSEWKNAKVIPSFKKGKRTMLDNYRPISILPVVSKLIERILYDQIYGYFNQEKLFSKQQFGFRPCHSTTTTLLDCTNEWYANMDRGLYSLVIFLDLKKAFDTVNHEIMLSKFQMYGFKEKAINLLRCYLTHRTQRCQLNDKLSGEKEVICGIPQGSILGPLLFLIYINDFPNCLNGTTSRLFADDTNLTAVGETVDEVEGRADIDMGNVRKWLRANKLSLNIGKTEYILIGSRHKTNSIDTERGIKIENQVIKKVRNTKVLGVKLDENLSWEKHIDHISSKITSGIGAIMRIKDYVEQSTLVTVYNVLIQPYFDYCCEIWGYM